VKLPALDQPQRYVGLYVYDFGDHASVGYTAREIRYLRESQSHRHGTAYEIYRATDDGVVELRGTLDERLGACEAMCFLRHDAAQARRDYDAYCESAERHPVPCPTEILLARLYDFEPPDVTALLYAASAGTAMSGWLTSAGVRAGDVVVGGIDAHAQLVASGGLRIASRQLRTLIDYQDRSAEEVLRTIHLPLQR